MNLRRLSFLATTTLCAVAFLFGAPGAKGDEPWNHYYSTGKAPVIGTLFSKGKLEVNRQSVSKSTAGGAVSIKDCILIRTFDKPATIKLSRGGYILIKANSIVQVCLHGRDLVQLTTTEGGAEVHYLDKRNPQEWLNDVKSWLADAGITGSDTAGYLSSLGFSGVFPSFGGGGSSYPNP